MLYAQAVYNVVKVNQRKRLKYSRFVRTKLILSLFYF